MGVLDIPNESIFPGLSDLIAPGTRLSIFRAGSEIHSRLFEDADLTKMIANPLKADDQGRLPHCFLPDGLYRIILRSREGRELYALDNVRVRSARKLDFSYSFRTIRDLLADTSLSYDTTPGRWTILPGDILQVLGGGFTYKVLPPEDPAADLVTPGGVALQVDLTHSTEISVRAFGAMADGVTDDAPALNRAIAAVENAGGTLILPSGHYRYGSELSITKALSIRGAGRRTTIFEPMPGYSGWFLGITESNFIGTSNGGPVVDMSRDSSGLELRGFSVRSTRGLGQGLQHGIRCIGRNDRMHWENIYIECLEGTHFHFGHAIDNDPTRPAFIRECDFYNVESRGGGTSDGYHPSVIFDSYGPGDASNLCNFFSFRVVYPYNVGLDMRNHAENNAIRRLSFFNLLLHGPGNTGIAATDTLCRLRGSVYWLNFFGVQINSTNAGQIGLHTETYSGNSPRGLRFMADVSSGDGDSFVFDAGSEIMLSCSGFGATGTDIAVGAGVTGPVTIDAFGMSPDMTVAPEAERHVNCLGGLDESRPFRTGAISLGSLTTSPKVFQGNGEPETVMEAPAGSIYLNRGQDGTRNADSAYLKRGGLGKTGWDAIMLATGGTTAQRPPTATPYQVFFDLDESRPFFARDTTTWVAGATYVAVPASPGAPGTAGDIAADASHVYVCIAADTWVRCEVAAW